MLTKGSLSLLREDCYLRDARWIKLGRHITNDLLTGLKNKSLQLLFTSDVDPEAFKFMGSDPSVPRDADEDNQWLPIRILGKGGHGIAGLWAREDASGNGKTEYVVVKQEECPPSFGDENDWKMIEHGPFKGVSREAFLMQQLNQRNCRNIIELRGYKRQKRGKLQRFYYEFAPNSDLYELKTRYRAWNQPIPEEFLWFLLKGLAEAQRELVTGLWKDPATGEVIQHRDHFMVQFDLKPDNIFLGDAEEPEFVHGVSVQESFERKTFASEYPCPKMADFGLAAITWPGDPLNTHEMRWRNTPGYGAPECENPDLTWSKRVIGKVHLDLQRSGQNDKPTEEELRKWRRAEDDDPGYIFDKSYDIWPIGKIMFELMTLRSNSHFGETSWPTEEEYWDKFQEEITNTLLDTNKRPEYSPQLKDTILHCLRLDPSKRPTAQQIIKIADEWLTENQDVLDELGLPIPRLYYQGNEINELPAGDDNNLKEPMVEQRHFLKHRKERKLYKNIDLEELFLGNWDPRAKAVTQPMQRRYIGGKQARYQYFVTQIDRETQPGKADRLLFAADGPVGGTQVLVPYAVNAVVEPDLERQASGRLDNAQPGASLLSSNQAQARSNQAQAASSQGQASNNQAQASNNQAQVGTNQPDDNPPEPVPDPAPAPVPAPGRRPAKQGKRKATPPPVASGRQVGGHNLRKRRKL